MKDLKDQSIETLESARGKVQDSPGLGRSLAALFDQTIRRITSLNPKAEAEISYRSAAVVKVAEEVIANPWPPKG